MAFKRLKEAERASFCSRCEYFWVELSLVSTFHAFPGLAPSFCHPNQNFFACFWMILKLQIAPAQFPALVPSPETNVKGKEPPQGTLKCFGLWQPNSPLSNNFSSSSVVNLRNAFGLCPRPCFTRYFRLAANTSLERQNSSSWRILKGGFNSLRWRCLLFWKLEILSGSYSLPLCLRTSLKNLLRSLSRVVAGMFITLKFPLTCCSQNAWNFFHSYFVFFTMFDDLSAAMKLSSSWLELSPSSSSFCKNSKKPTRKFGLSVAVFYYFSSFAYFSFKYVSKFSSWDILQDDFYGD